MMKMPHAARTATVTAAIGLLSLLAGGPAATAAIGDLVPGMPAGDRGMIAERLDWVGPDGQEIPSKVPEFIGLYNSAGELERCADGRPVQVPYQGWGNGPVRSHAGTLYPNLQAAQDATRDEVLASATRDADGTVTLHLDDETVFRPDPASLCLAAGRQP